LNTKLNKTEKYWSK